MITTTLKIVSIKEELKILDKAVNEAIEQISSVFATFEEKALNLKYIG